MRNLTKEKRENLLSFLDELKNKQEEESSVVALNEIENFILEKKYGLLWEEHSERVDRELKTKIPIFKEVEDNSNGTNELENLNFLIEGDNLHSLYLLEKTHREKVDVIYIDPPYNTGNKDFMYGDDYVDKEDGFKHSKWLSFMHKRLTIARSLLKEDGIIAISIDENEYAPLKMLCDEVFGEYNRLTTNHIQVRYENKSLNEDNDWQPVMEYVLIYGKETNKFIANKPYEPYDLSKFKYEIVELTEGEIVEIGNRKVTIFKNGEWEIKEVEGHINGLKETWASGSLVRQGGTAAEFLSKYLIERKDIDGLNVLYKIDGMGKDGDGLGYRYVTGPKRKNAIRGKFYSGVPLVRREELKSGVSNKTRPIANYINYSADFGNIRHEGGVPFNNGKKPIKMIKEIINYHTKKDITILDFFAGSGSTAHAVLDLNREDNGERNFIICTNNENNICEEVTLKRLNNISKDYKFGLKYYKTDYIKKNGSEDFYISTDLMEHIGEMIQLEYHISLDFKENVLIKDDDEKFEFFAEESNLNTCKKIFKPSFVFLSTKEINKIQELGIEIITVPDYYFAKELREVGEL